MIRTRVKTIALLFTFLFPALCFSLPEDREQIIKLHADTADLNQSTHRGVYKGNVCLDQGTTHVRAAEAITEGNAENKLVMALAKGDKKNQAHYWATPEKDKPELHAFADEIYYYPERHVIELVGNARIQQGENSFSAAKIIYDTESQHVLTENNGKGRTTIIIHPENKS